MRIFVMLRIFPTLLVVLATLASAGEQKSAKLVYARLDGALACPDSWTMEKAVAARLGYNPFFADAIDVIRVIVEPRREALAARLEMRSGSAVRGTRDLESTSRDCGELAAALSLAIAIAIDPQTWVGSSQPAAAVAPAPPPSITTPPPPPPLVDAEESSLKLQAGLGVMGLWGTSPNFTGGLLVRLTLGGSHWSVSLDGRADLPQSLPAGPGDVSVRNFLGSFAPCVHLSYFGACGVVAGGVTSIATQGLVDSRNGLAPLFQAGARVRGDFPLTERLTLGGAAEALVPLARAVLDVGDERLWATPPVNISGSILVAFSLL